MELAVLARLQRVRALFPIFHPVHRLTPGAIAWIPDLQHRALPGNFSTEERASRDAQFGSFVGSPGHVVFSSRHALEHALESYGPATASLHVLHFATVPDDSWRDDPSPVVAKYKLPPEFIIVCNQFWAHKDHRIVFEALRLLKGRDSKVALVCTGPTDDYRNPGLFPELKAHIARLGLTDQVFILGLLPRYDQIMLMKASLMVVQPSRFEGWSTVLEDARALGKRTVSSDFPVHLEQDLPGALYFERGNAEACAEAIDAQLPSSAGRGNGDIPTHHGRLVQEFARSFLHIASSATSHNGR